MMMMMMDNELHRLASFAAWSHALLSPLGLARLGLWYDAKDGAVKCYSCKAEFRTVDDGLQTRHRERVPSCEHLRNTACTIPLKFLDCCNSLSSDTTIKDRTSRGFTSADNCGTVNTVHRSRNGDCEQKHEQLYHLVELYRTACRRAQKNGLFHNVSDDTRLTEHGSFVGSDSSLSDRCNVNVGATTSASELQAMSGAPQILVKDSTTATAFSPIPEIQQISIAGDPPKFPQYADNFTRVESFRNGIVGQGQTAEGLAAAGWFYVGPNDKVRCFQCGGNLRDWEQGDDPWTEHRRWYNYCQFAKTHGPSSRSRVPENSLPTIPPIIGSYRIEPREVKARMDTPTVRAILDMGYSHDKVKAVIETRLSTTGDDFPNAEILLDAIFQLEETTSSTASTGATSSVLSSESVNNSMYNNSSPQHVTESPNHSVTSSLSSCDVNQPALTSMPAITSSSRNSPTVESSNSLTPEADAMSRSKAKKKRNKKMKHAPATSASTVNAAVEATQTVQQKETAGDEQHLEELQDEESMKWLEENRQLREQRTCKVCMDAEVNTVFLPCGHLVCCATCSPHLRNCPICRTFIRGTVKTFLS